MRAQKGGSRILLRAPGVEARLRIGAITPFPVADDHAIGSEDMREPPLANAVKVTLGPKGRNVLIEK